jgi:hypothetical protein
LTVETLEDRIALATVTIANGDVTGLTNAITAANANNTSADIINLTPGPLNYVLTTANDNSVGPSAFAIKAKGGFSLTINGNGATLQAPGSAANPMRIFLVTAGSTFILNNTTLTGGFLKTGNHPNGSGGAIDQVGGTMTLNSCTLTGNTLTGGHGGYGGALYQTAGATGTLNDTTVSNNTGYYGGGITGRGLLTLNRCTISGNTSPFFGGGGVTAWTGTIKLYDSTVYGNKTTTMGGNGYGGGICDGGGTISLANSTITGNINSGTAGGGGIKVRAGTTTLTNTIVAGNTDANSPDISGTVQGSSSFNLVGNGAGLTGISNGSNGNQIGVAAPMLGKLQNNGGITQTVALLPSSPAIDKGSNTGAPANDQRGAGFNRIINGTIDIGAYEFQFPNTSTTVVSSLNPTRKNQSVTFTATVTVTTPGSNAPQGTVTFLDGSTPLATVALSNGTAAFTTAALSIGFHTITAQYNGFTQGDYIFNPSSASLTQKVNGALSPTIYAVGADAGAAPEVQVYSAVTGALLFDFLPYGQSFRGGVHVAIGDVNGDGIADIITGPGSGGGPLVKIFNGKDLSLIAAFNAYDPNFLSGVNVASGDVNGDGIADIITAPDAGGGPLVEAFNGKDLSLLMAFNAYDPAFRGGVHVAAGDVNGDGDADIITGPGIGGGPLVNVYSGATGVQLISYNAYPLTGTFLGGVFVAAGDLDGDGMAEVIAGPGFQGGPLIRVFQGLTGNLIVSFNAYDPTNANGQVSDILDNAAWVSGARVATTDINGDGKAEIVTGPGPGQPAHIRIFDATSLAILDDFFAFNSNLTTGVFVA